MFLASIFLLILFFLVGYLLYKIIILYFNYKKNIQNKEYYPIIFGMTLASVPIIAKISSLDSIIITLFNQYLHTNIPIPKSDITGWLTYLLYIGIIGFLSFIYYTRENNTHKKEEIKQTIIYSQDDVIISPYLHERIQELFELKYEKNNLKLKYDSKEKLLFGEFSEQFHNHRFYLYCDETLNQVSIEKQNEIFEKLQKLNNSIDNTSKKYDIKYFYFIKNGKFKQNTNTSILCYTEENFINSIIDFTSYLKKTIEIFNKSESDIGGKSLENSFIEPYYNNGKTNLSKYLDEWINEKSCRHITILADYGMGKTTYLKYYTKYLAEKILNKESFSRYPIFISLTNTSPMSNDGIAIKIESFVAKELGINYSLFEKLVQLGKIVFILDGFDEMGFIGTKKTRFEQFKSIWKLATKNNKLLISGRPSYLPTEFERKNVLNIIDKDLYSTQMTPFTEIVELDFFKTHQIFQTLEMYYKKSEEINKYKLYIKKNKSIYDLCKRPSLLHMTMYILPSIYEEKPEDVTSSMIMSKYIDYWINRQEKKNIVGFYSSQDENKRKFIIDFFTTLSVEMFKNKTLVISKNELDAIIEDEIKNHKIDINPSQQEYEGFINEIYTGYFIEIDINKEDHFKFVHKSIFEFFVSKKIIEFIKNGEFNNSLLYSTWNTEITDFVRDNIKYNQKKSNQYPALIMLRNSVFDRIIFVPFTKIWTKKKLLFLTLSMYISAIIISFIVDDRKKEPVIDSFNIEPILYGVIGGVFISFFIKYLKKRFLFIKKAYLIDYQKSKITTTQMQYFLDFSSQFRFLENIILNEFKYENLYIRNLFFFNSVLKTVTFKNSKIKELTFKNTQLEQINFESCNIRYLHFKNTELKNIVFDNCKFITWKVNNYSFLKLLQFYNITKNTPPKILFNVFHELFSYKDLLKRYKPRIVLYNVKMDKKSIMQFQKFIKENNIGRKYIICENNLKNQLFK